MGVGGRSKVEKTATKSLGGTRRAENSKSRQAAGHVGGVAFKDKETRNA